MMSMTEASPVPVLHEGLLQLLRGLLRLRLRLRLWLGLLRPRLHLGPGGLGFRRKWQNIEMELESTPNTQ